MTGGDLPTVSILSIILCKSTYRTMFIVAEVELCICNCLVV
jgi:hypothetical protein